MKSTGEVYQLARGETGLRIDDECSRLLRLAENSVLYVVGLAEQERVEAAAASEPARSATKPLEDTVFIASPYPTSSWNNLFRASFILKRETGLLNRLLEKLNELRIFCRSLEFTSSLPLRDYGFLAHTLPHDRILGGAKSETMVPATVVLVLEIPELSALAAAPPQQDPKDSNTPTKNPLLALHEAIHAMLEWRPIVADEATPADPNNEAPTAPAGAPDTSAAELASHGVDVPTARCALHTSIGIPGVIVEWTSAMRTIREISRLWKDPRLQLVKQSFASHKRDRAPDVVQLLGDVETDVARNIAERGLEKVRECVRRDQHGLYVDAAEWRGDIWRPDRNYQDTGHTARVRTADKLVITHADSDEKILYWHVRSLRERCIVAFSVTFPSGGMESAWCEWITGVIKEYGGGVILSAQLSARGEPESDRLQIRGGRWASLRLVVEFSGIVDNGRAQQIVRCFVKLQGKEAGSGGQPTWEKQLQDFLDKRRYIKELLPAPERRIPTGDSEPWRVGTIVSHVMLWYEHHLDALHHIEFWSWPNLFDFTGPYGFPRHPHEAPRSMDAWGRQQIEKSRGGLSRETLVRRVVESLLKRGRVALVGAHRSGKTSVLREIKHTVLVNSLKFAPGSAWIPIHVDAGVCPPVQLCVEILRQIRDGSGAEDGAPLQATRLDSSEQFKDVLTQVAELEKQLVELERLLERLSPQPRTDGEPSDGPLGQRDKFLRDSRNLLTKLLRLRVDGWRLRIAVMVDGVTADGPWMERWAQAFWRELIESRDLEDVAWVITTSQPLGETLPFSISSVFCEHNLDPLDEYETDLLINRIDTPGAAPPPPELLPVLTLSARRFLAWVSARMPYLLQVCCYYLFERARRMRVPLLCTRVAIEVIDNEVLPQLTDYLEGEWGRLPLEARRYVLSTLAPLSGQEPRQTLFAKVGAASAQFAAAPPPVQKALLRSGLTGAHEFGLVAPLVAFWLRRSGRDTAADA